MNLISPPINDGLVAMDSHLNKMRGLLYAAPDDDVVYVGIWGMGGLGKKPLPMLFIANFLMNFITVASLQM